jgi:hypothetical protein
MIIRMLFPNCSFFMGFLLVYVFLILNFWKIKNSKVYLPLYESFLLNVSFSLELLLMAKFVIAFLYLRSLFQSAVYKFYFPLK